jgi:hypothetical protein
VDVRDIHGDGQQELIIQSGMGAHWSIMHVFAFDSKAGLYRVQAEFDGDGGAGLGVPDDFKDTIKDGAIAAARDYSTSQLIYEQIFRWSKTDNKYVRDTTRVDFVFGKPDKLTLPSQVVLLYYDAISHKDYKTAYSYLSARVRQTQSYTDFAKGYTTTKLVWIEDLTVPTAESDATIDTSKNGSFVVPLTIKAQDDAGNGQIKSSEFKGSWTVVINNGIPYLDKADIKKL